MSLVNVTNVVVLDNPTQFTNPFQFEITFECLQDLSEDLEWKVIYVGSSESSEYDQDLEEVLVGPVTAGCHKFVLQADAPDPTLMFPHSPLGITVVLITCSYRDHEFVRIGYYVNNDYSYPTITEAEATVEGEGESSLSSLLQQQQQQESQSPAAAAQQQPRVLMIDDDTMNDDDDDDAMLTTPQPQFNNSSMSLDLTKIVRTVLADKPRVTRFAIPWEDDEVAVVATVETESSYHHMEEEQQVVVEQQQPPMVDNYYYTAGATGCAVEPATTTMMMATSSSPLDDHLRVVSPTNKNNASMVM
mmetsp:Transcript_11446/g.19030  ORF Transcript_11446/g.19030 Transcript_11446/m.19030 type:complete len:303 (+) Transcript_11446:125-1033(+)|eukprot:CAMPEP_0119016494 /NCGR_PEP_ID=MMETSP1176-20130426/13286_1 /TAXON_ID=265551 /ORGANISM="Synedropsis recta cf, Strain CCMP1620" /LENGTH=302 /DNA_ID=CAMNT_0006969935 /DNA_START=116 /DNA_END=1024 /DNA_ORIENTATION=+